MLEPWWLVSDTREASALEAELRRELAAAHPLHGCPVTAIGWRADCDDVLFRLRDGTGRYAVVHLTWTGRREQWPCPLTTFYASPEDWAERRMNPDHEAFSSAS